MRKGIDVRAGVEDELIFDPLLNASSIAVMASGGKVTLSGTVPSYQQYLRAADAARRVAGVTGVSNYLAVLVPPRDHREDGPLTTAANDALTGTVTVPDGVDASARDGGITLTGTVRHAFQRAAAADAVAMLTGVRDVVDNIEISCDAGQADAALALDALDRSALIPGDSDVAVDSDGNTLTLTGHVRTWAAHDAVLGAAWMTPGVRDVRDDLHVTG